MIPALVLGLIANLLCSLKLLSFLQSKLLKDVLFLQLILGSQLNIHLNYHSFCTVDFRSMFVFSVMLGIQSMPAKVVIQQYLIGIALVDL